MKKFRSILPVVIACFFVLLFAYAAVSKLMDFEVFSAQLAQSPLFGEHFSFIPFTIIGSEIIIAGLLCYGVTRKIGLLFSILLMSMFTGYIIIITNFSEHIPCSCGGILKKMTWVQHLYFNIGCVILAGIALLIMHKQHRELAV